MLNWRRQKTGQLTAVQALSRAVHLMHRAQPRDSSPSVQASSLSYKVQHIMLCCHVTWTLACTRSTECYGPPKSFSAAECSLPFITAHPISIRCLSCERLSCFIGPRQCIGQSLARILHDASIARLIAHFSFDLAPRMAGPAGVDRQEINRLTLQPGAGGHQASVKPQLF